MKKFSIVASLAAIMIICTALPAAAQFRFGLRVGTNVSELHFNSKTFDSSNRMGFNAGAMVEFSAPMTGIGFDASVMYVRRNSDFMAKNSSSNNTSDNRDYIEIPLNLRYNLSLPVINNVIMPYIAAGPSVSFLTSRRSVENAFRNKSVDWALNFGIGVQLVKHIDISARYGLGLTKAVKAISDYEDAGIQGKNRYWTISVAYLF